MSSANPPFGGWDCAAYDNAFVRFVLFVARKFF